jgi:inhibitor of KinA sporulation pathway (predicted exonuclease)
VIAIDCEGVQVTGEGNKSQDLAASVAIVDVKGQLLFHCFVNHSDKKVNNISRATGIKPEDMERSCVTLPWLQDFLKEFTKHRPKLIGAGIHNEYKFLDLPPYQDAVDIQSFYYRDDATPIALELLGQRFADELKWKEKIGEQHQAIHDARLTMKLYNLYQQLKDDVTFIDKIRTTAGYDGCDGS